MVSVGIDGGGSDDLLAVQQRVFFEMQTAQECGESRHPQVVLRALENTLGFKIVQMLSQPLHDGWEVWIEADREVAWPKYIRVLEWRHPDYWKYPNGVIPGAK